MMKQLRYIFYSLAITLGAWSCSGDFLEKKPLDKLSDAAVWNDLSLIETFVNDIYNNLPSGFDRGWYMLASGTDDAENSYAWPASQAFNRGDYYPSNYPLSGTWSNAYAAIRKTNIFLERIDEVEGNEEWKKRLTGEVKFLRAFYYFELTKFYGGVPLITKSLTLDDDLSISRNTYEECLTFIISELDEAAELLPEAYGTADLGRATKGAALGIKGRALLYAEKWDESAAASKAVIDLGVYSLFEDYEGIFHAENDNNAEVVFDKQFQEPDYGHWGQLFNLPKNHPGGRGWGGTNPTQELVDMYEMTDGNLYQDSPLYDPAKPYENRDPRFYASVFYDGVMFGGAPVQSRVGGTSGIGSHGDATKTGYYMRKFMEEERAGDAESVAAGNNWIIMRYAEILLNYAEAKNESEGAVSDVYEAVNLVRARVNMPPLPGGLSKEEMREKIRHERRIELAFEEHRFWDVRRWKIAENVLNGKIHGVRIGPNGELSGQDANGKPYGRIEVESRNFDPSKHYLFPIPQSEIEKNSNMEQNPGW
ncbi:RagB/SusD family nutrient uptake outer membrane protein [Rapidithrix thailandica]|uniref:RagB/SusD family nutrient uptake outer membrane protein n=1 Tax=Rapidithrix thailandica TaxID=413964 RepID=A0AAW9SHI9_9BACT